MINIFSNLPVEEIDEIVIDSENRLRNCKKTLKKKKEKYSEINDPKFKKEIDELTTAILEYENKDHKMINEVKKIKKEKNIFDENDYLNKESKKVRILKKKQKVKQERIVHLWTKSSLNPPQWDNKRNMLFPDKLIIVMIHLFGYHNNQNTIFSVLPKDILIYILENYITWIDFPEEDDTMNKIKIKNKTIVYSRNKSNKSKSRRLQISI